MTAAAAAATAPLRHAGVVTGCVMLATIMQALDTTIANVALPYIQGSLSATLDQVNWVLTSYIVAAAIMTPLTGWVADRYGRKRVFMVTVVGFTIASMLCGAATSLGQIVVFRLLQGVFGAPLVPLSQAVLLDTYPREKHGQAMALWGVGVMLGPILGPTLGGWLTETLNWRWVFYVNLPVGVLTFLGLSSFLADTPGRNRAGFDWFGFATLSLAIGALQMMLDRGQQLDWFGSAEIVAEATLAGVALYLFLVHTLTAERPFIDPRLFRDRNLTAGLALIFVVGIVLLATLALLTPFLQNLLGYPVLTAGLVLAPRGIGTMIAMFMVGRLIERVDIRLLLVAGLCFMTAALWRMTNFTTDASSETIVFTGILQGFGLGFLFVPLSTITFATLAPEFRGQATALFSLMRNLGSSIGISVVIWLLARNAEVVHAALVEHITAFNPLLHQPALAGLWNLALPAGRAGLDAVITVQATIIAYNDDYWFMLVLTLLAAPLLLVLKPPPRRAAPGPGAAIE